MRQRIPLIIALIVVIGAAVAGAVRLRSESGARDVTVIASYPLALQSAEEIIDSLKIALEESNYIAGQRRVRLIVLDDGTPDGDWDPEREAANATRAASDPAAVAYIGPLNSGAAKVSMPILNRAGIVQLNVGNTWPGLTKVGYAPGEPGVFYPTGVRHYVRVNTTDDHQGPAAAIWARELGFGRVYIIDDGESYGKGIADLFRDKATELGMTVLGQETLDAGAPDYTEVVRRIVAEKPDLIYFGGIVPNGIDRFIVDMQDLGHRIQIMGPDGLTGQDLVSRIGAERSDGVLATTVAVPISLVDTPAAAAYREIFEERFGRQPDPFSAYGYEAGRVLIDALRRAASADRASVLKAIRETRNFNGIFGTWSFDQNGDTDLPILSGNVMRNGAFEFVTRLTTP